MNDSEAIKILGLGNSFTGEEELFAFRNRAKKYHPDNYDNATEKEKIKATEMMSKINAAHVFLRDKYFPKGSDTKKRVTITPSSSYSNTFDKSSDVASYKAKKSKKWINMLKD